MKLFSRSCEKWIFTAGKASSAALLTLSLVLAGCTSPEPSVKAKSAKPESAPSGAVAPSTNRPPPLASASKAGKPAGKTFPQTHDWVSLFDGKTLDGWAITDFSGRGPVRVSDGKLLLESGVMTGVTWTNDIPRMNYEVELEAMRVDGSDFFCALTFPVGTNPCSLIIGGWGGGVVGLSSLDGEDAANNETTKYMSFENGRWYKVRLRVAPNQIQSWIDSDKVVDVVTTDRRISIRIEVELSVPFGIATWSTTGAIRNLRVRRL